MIAARAQGAIQNVIAVGRHHKTINRQTHLSRDIARKNIAEIASRHGKADGTMWGAKADCGGKIVDNLRHDTCPVDRVHPRQAHLIAEGEIIKHIFEPRLRIVKCAVNGQSMGIGLGDRGHLAALHLGHTAMGEQDEHRHRIKPAKCLHRGRACIA